MFGHSMWCVFKTSCINRDGDSLSQHQLSRNSNRMKLLAVFLVLLGVRFSFVTMQNDICPISANMEDTKPLYLLTLVPFPDQAEGVGWDGGLEVLSGARIAQDEINTQANLLPGYHVELIVKNVEACSHLLAGTGLVNLVKHTVNPLCQPVVAVTGLICSSHTTILSPVAGHDGYDLIQLSAANSPIFQTQPQYFPHLWQFLGSATVYADTLLAIMDQYNWTRIGVLYDTGSSFFSDSMRYLEQKIKKSSNKTIDLSIGIRGTKYLYFNYAISNIKSHNVTILVCLLNMEQSSILLSVAVDGGVVYPTYTWIHIESVVQYLLDQESVDNHDKLYRAVTGHIFLHTLTKLENKSEVLISGINFTAFQSKYYEDIEKLRKLYSTENINADLTFASYMYDQLWALALAVNISLPILESRNLSISNYTIGQPSITAVIEEQMSNLSFQGAGGWVEFNQHRSVSTPVEIFWIMDNGTQKQVGLYNPLNHSHFYIDINSSDLPSDTLPQVYNYVLIRLPVAISLYIIAGAVIMFTTVQLILYLHYRHHKMIKATSPYLSLLMFAGCYLLCIASIVKVTYGTFDNVATSKQTFVTMLSINIVIVLNGLSLILVTMIIKLLRVYRIFFSKLKVDLGKYWSNCPLLFTILCLTVVPNIVIVPLIIVHTPIYGTYSVQRRNGSLTITNIHIELKTPSYFAIGGLIACYVTILSLTVVYLSFRTRNVIHRNFKDTKKLNIFVFVLMFILLFTAPLYVAFLFGRDEVSANLVLVVGMLTIAAASQLILFLPKVLPTALSSVFLNWEVRSSFCIKYLYSHKHNNTAAVGLSE